MGLAYGRKPLQISRYRTHFLVEIFFIHLSIFVHRNLVSLICPSENCELELLGGEQAKRDD